MIISFIGIRGAGKSTQCALLQSYLNSIGRPAQVVKALDDEIKSRFLDIISANSYMANVFLFCMLYRRQVDQTQMLQQQGYLVITDRFIEYFRLYHTYEGLLTTHSTDLYEQFERLVFGSVRPDLIVYLRVDLKTANQRIENRRRSSPRQDFMFETDDTYLKATTLYDQLAATGTCKVVDGSMNPMEVHRNIVAQLRLCS